MLTAAYFMPRCADRFPGGLPPWNTSWLLRWRTTSPTADCVCLKRPPPARVPCPRATPGLPLATLQASGRVAPVPKRFAV